jgi:SAM-dependent methyltransferase
MPCPICNEREAWPIPFRHDTQIDSWRAGIGDNAPYRWQLCRRCGNGYPSSQPDLRVLGRVWESNRSLQPSDCAATNKIWTYRQAISRAGAERSYRFFAPLAGATPGRFLDVACGLGETVKLFERHGWTAEGIDADPSTEPFHRRLGIRSHIGQFETVDVGQNYDLIHIAHAIYFITDPMGFLRAVRNRLRPHGVFCVVISDFMSNVDSSLPSYAHTFYPVRTSMIYALTLAGFEIVSQRSGAGSIYIAARPASRPVIPPVNTLAIRAAYGTKSVRYLAFGRPYLAVRRWAKQILRRS